jgi:hypothetical protein
MGIMAAESLHAGELPDLWHINTDSEYQEAGSSMELRENQ